MTHNNYPNSNRNESDPQRSSKLARKVGKVAVALVAAGAATLTMNALRNHEQAAGHPQLTETVGVSASQRHQVDQTAEKSARFILSGKGVFENVSAVVEDGKLKISGLEWSHGTGRGSQFHVDRTVEFEGAPRATDPQSVEDYLDKHPHLAQATTRYKDAVEDFTTSVSVGSDGHGKQQLTVSAPAHDGFDFDTLPQQFYDSPPLARANYIANGFADYAADAP